MLPDQSAMGGRPSTALETELNSLAGEIDRLGDWVKEHSARLSPLKKNVPAVQAPMQPEPPEPCLSLIGERVRGLRKQVKAIIANAEDMGANLDI